MCRARAVVLLVALSLAGCVRRSAPPTEALDKAAERVGPGSDANTLALAGFHALLVEGDAAKATTRFDDAIAKNDGEPWALVGQIFLAQRVMVPQKALAAALALLEKAPKHPLAPIAARVVLDTSGLSSETANQVRERAPRLLEKGLQPDAAHLLRSALVNAYLDSNELQPHAQVLSDMGVPTTGTIIGPFSAYHLLDTATATAPEKNGSLEQLGSGPFGALTARVFRFADGRISLAGEPLTGDVYLYAVDVNVPEGGAFVLRTVTSMDHVAVLDGTEVLSRFTVKRPAPTLTSRVVKLDKGAHRLMIRMARENQQGNFTVALQRLDGMPAGLIFTPSQGSAPRWNGVKFDTHDELYSSAESVRYALEPEAGDALARVVAARDALGRDRDGARAMLSALPENVNSPVVAVLRADVYLQDRSVPARVSRGRATRELELALSKDTGFVAAKMFTAQLALDDGRQLEALDMARAAKAAHSPPGASVLLLMARIELALGLDAAAAATAREAEKALGGSCEGVLLQYDIARRRDAVTEGEALLKASSHCNGALMRSADYLRSKGELKASIAQWEEMLARDEGQVSIATTLSGLYVSERRYDDAVKLLTRLQTQWPRNAQLYEALGDVQELAGREKEAMAAREQALLLDGANLALRRAMERRKTGRELLDQWAISTEEALKSYEAAPGSEDATSSFVLDAAAIQGFADGTMVDRVHIIQKALDQQGVQDIAEVQIPPGATVLTLRTLKPDGRKLEPEVIEGKDVMSLPGVQVGDMVEYEYLLVHPTRGPAQPGFTASAFYFQVARQPNARSSYVVIAPKGSNLTVDAHNVKAPKPQVEGDFEVLRHEERRVPPYIPEPGGPPSANEWLPFVSVGTGQRGNDGVVRAYADAFLDKGLITHEVEAFAREAVKGAKGLEAVKLLYAEVQKKLSGRDGGLAISAATSAAQDRGSRTWLLKSSLEALGFDTRLVAVRAFTSDPAAYVFPNEALLPYVCLRVALPDGTFIWLDPLVRFAPFGELPEFALGGLEAWLLPEPGLAMEQVKTPERNSRPGKTVTLTLALDEQGVLSGKGEEQYTGFDAAQLAEALESISPEQRDQALQSSLSRYFGGADLSKLEVDAPRAVGATVTVRYAFRAERFGRLEGAGRLIASSPTYPLMLGRRFLQVATRVTPLFIEASEASFSKATLTLPPGWSLKGALGEVKLNGPSGTYVRREVQSGNVVTFEEDFRLTQSRVPTKEYDNFGQFAGELDLLQQRDLLFEKK